MNAIKIEELLALLQCPECHESAFSGMDNGLNLNCELCGAQYPISHGRPVLLRSENDVFCLDDYRNLSFPESVPKERNWQRFIPSSSLDLACRRVLTKVRKLIEEVPSAKVLVVGGGNQRKWLDGYFRSVDSIKLLYIDIDIHADVDLFCDGHNLPFIDGTFDAVIATAVIEHVLYPEQVAVEIIRVLKVSGLLYSDIPFMQQVHEGAYDFTRYTLSGHRRLFNSISEIESGMVAGPGTALVWAVENFAIAFVAHQLPRNIIKAVIRMAFGWIKYFDLLFVNKPTAMDGASCTYLLGRKLNGKIADSKIIAQYVGGQKLKHS